MSATSIFGGAQVLRIIVGVVRSKLIAILLGPTGMGISGLIQATTDMVASLTNFGLSTSGVRSISELYAKGEEEYLHKKVAVFKKLIWLTGILGAVITLVLSKYLSILTFGDSSYTWAFAIMSIALLVNQISLGQSTILMATRHIKMMAKSSVWGSVIGLIITVPLYYFYGNDAIAPALVITALISLLLTWYYVSKLSFKNISITISDLKIEGKEMMTMGLLISLTSIISYLVSYIVRLFISKTGNIDDVGLYNAGFAIVNVYVGMVFTAMTADYYPKLSAMASDRLQLNNAVNQQAEIAILILGPIILIFIVFIKWLIFLLYSEAFLPIDKMIMYAASGMLFKALSWSISYVFLAKNSQKLFFWNEFIANAYLLILNLIGYYYGGLTGLGVSFIVGYFLYFIQVFFIAKHLFSFTFKRELISIFFPNLFFTVVCLYSSFSFGSANVYMIGLAAIAISIFFNLYHLNNRIDLKSKFFG